MTDVKAGKRPGRLVLQKRIAEYIRQKNIQDNLEAAWEHNPEVFGHINMLYVNMEVGASACLCWQSAHHEAH